MIYLEHLYTNIFLQGWKAFIIFSKISEQTKKNLIISPLFILGQYAYMNYNGFKVYLILSFCLINKPKMLFLSAWVIKLSIWTFETIWTSDKVHEVYSSWLLLQYDWY